MAKSAANAAIPITANAAAAELNPNSNNTTNGKAGIAAGKHAKATTRPAAAASLDTVHEDTAAVAKALDAPDADIKALSWKASTDSGWTLVSPWRIKRSRAAVTATPDAIEIANSNATAEARTASI